MLTSPKLSENTSHFWFLQGDPYRRPSACLLWAFPSPAPSHWGELVFPSKQDNQMSLHTTACQIQFKFYNVTCDLHELKWPIKPNQMGNNKQTTPWRENPIICFTYTWNQHRKSLYLTRLITTSQQLSLQRGGSFHAVRSQWPLSAGIDIDCTFDTQRNPKLLTLYSPSISPKPRSGFGATQRLVVV